MLKMKDLEEMEQYIDSGNLAEDFGYSEQDRRYELLDMLEKLIILGEKADQVATDILLKGHLEKLAGIKEEK